MSTVLIVGSSRGIGRSLALQYMRDGWKVLATARTLESVEDLREQGAEVFALDVTVPEQVNAFDQALDGTPIDVAIIVSGVYGPRTTAVERIERHDFDDIMSANVRGPMELLPILLPRVEAVGGTLAALSSIMGRISDPTGTDGWLYRVSKAALNSALSLASLTLKRSSCISIHPGWVRTQMGGPDADLDQEESASGIRQVIRCAQTDPKGYNGRFVQWNGDLLEW